MSQTRLQTAVTAAIVAVTLASHLTAQSIAPAARQSSTTAASTPSIKILGINRRDQPDKWWSASGEPLASRADVEPAVRGFLGVAMSDVSESSEESRKVGYTGADCVTVHNVLPNSPAVGKIKPGDLITHIDGESAKNITNVRRVVGAATPGTAMTFRVFREGKSVDLTINLGQPPKEAAIRRSNTFDSFQVDVLIQPCNRQTGIACSTTPEFSRDWTSDATTVFARGTLILRTPRDTHQFNLNIGLANGPWQTLMQSNDPQKDAVKQLDGGGAFTIHPAANYLVLPGTPAGESAARNPGAYVRVERTGYRGAEPYDARLTALVEDKEVVAAHFTPIIHGDVRNDIFYFAKVVPDAIVGTLFQTRPFDWTTIPNVALELKTAP
jgi:hypothetical protein